VHTIVITENREDPPKKIGTGRPNHRPSSLLAPLGFPKSLASDPGEFAHALEAVFGWKLKEIDDRIYRASDALKRASKQLCRGTQFNAAERLFTLFIWPSNRLEAHNRRGRLHGLSLEIGLLRRFRPDATERRYDHQVFRALLPWWALVERQVESLDTQSQSACMVLLDALEDLRRWEAIDRSERSTLANAFFALMTLTGNRLVTDHAILHAPEIASELHGISVLQYVEGDGGQIGGKYPPPGAEIQNYLKPACPHIHSTVTQLHYLVSDLRVGHTNQVIATAVAGVARLNQEITDAHAGLLAEAEACIRARLERIKTEIATPSPAAEGGSHPAPVTGWLSGFCDRIVTSCLPVQNIPHAREVRDLIEEILAAIRQHHEETKRLDTAITAGARRLEDLVTKDPVANATKIAQEADILQSLKERYQDHVTAILEILRRELPATDTTEPKGSSTSDTEARGR